MSTDTTEPDKKVAESSGPKLPETAVKAIEKFLADHGETAKAVIQPIGLAGVRITLVGEDGVLGDQVVADVATANAVVASFDKVSVSEWDRAVTSIVTPREGHFAQMAGWVAKQTRFPKARNES
ncbi:hypothetical protein [Rhodococcus sp. NPDC058521]|uniref:hypothetical protein n=1 Tax=Rhodococcus sp. NPDC058521 TaxID=3346536 RepID=UPI0036675BCF